MGHILGGKLFQILAAAYFVSSVGLAQTPDTVTVSGRVTDSTMAVVPFAHVRLTDSTQHFSREADTDEHGSFSLAGLSAAGDYDLVAMKAGFSPAQLHGLKLTAGSTANVGFVLQVAGQVSSVMVSGSADSVRTDQPQLGMHLNSTQVQDTPLPYRRLTFLPLLDSANRPAVNQGDIFMNQNLFTSNGAGRRQTFFELDGANAVDAWGRQTIFTNLPLFALDQMNVLTNSFSAAYGAGNGAVLNLVTRHGSDEFHGQFLELWRPAATEAHLPGFSVANAATGNDLLTDTLGQTAVGLSGPLGRASRTTFFTAGEFNRQRKDSPITSPLAPGTYAGRYRGWLGVFRLDRQIGVSGTAFIRGNFDSFYDTNPNGIVGGASLATVARVFRRRTYAVEFGESTAFGADFLNSVRAQFQLGSPITEFDPVVYGTQFVVPVASGGTFTTGTSQSALLMNRQYEFTDTLSMVRGRNKVDLGGSVVAIHTGGNSKEFGGPLFLGKFTYKSCTQPAAVCESAAYLNDINNVANYQQSYGNANYTLDDQLWTVFGQDDFHVTQRLTLNLGLRYEAQTFTDARADMAPRVGFVFDTTGRGQMVVRGGFGIYYSQIVDNAYASYALGEPAGVFTYTATPGQVGFPASIAAAPLPVFPQGAIAPVRSLYVRPGQAAFVNTFLPVAGLNGYPNKLLPPYSEQWTLSVEQRLAANWRIGLDYVGTHTLRINRPLDIDAPSTFLRTTQGQIRTAQAANCTRPYWVLWYSQHGMTCNPNAATNPQPAYSVVQTDVADGGLHYDALDLSITKDFTDRLAATFSYTWSHTLDNVDPDTTGQNPNDPNQPGRPEYANAIYDQRHRLVVSGEWLAPWKIRIGGMGTLASSLPFNIVTGDTNSGDTGATTDRPVINGSIVGRNTGRGRPFYDVDPFVGREFVLRQDGLRVALRAEAFNVLNHANFVGYSGTFGEGATPPAGFGRPLPGVTSQLTARVLQFSVQFSH